MRVHIDINIPYSLKEIFSREVHSRASELRAEATEVHGKEGAAKFICKPHLNLGNKAPLDLSVSSQEDHKKVMNYLGQIKYGAYV